LDDLDDRHPHLLGDAEELALLLLQGFLGDLQVLVGVFQGCNAPLKHLVPLCLMVSIGKVYLLIDLPITHVDELVDVGIYPNQVLIHRLHLPDHQSLPHAIIVGQVLQDVSLWYLILHIRDDVN